MNTEVGHEETSPVIVRGTGQNGVQEHLSYNSTTNFTVGIKWTKNQYLHGVKRDTK